MKNIINEQINNDTVDNSVAAKKLLGRMLIYVAVVNLLEIIIKAALRYIYSDDTVLTSGLEAFLNTFRFIFVIVVYSVCLYRMHRISPENSLERKLMAIWGVILIPIQLINDLCAMLYTRTLEMVQAVMLLSGLDADGSIYAMIYDTSHGFKYICIFLSILLGIVITGEMLEKRKLLVFSLVVAILFMLAFTLFKMETVAFDTLSKLSVGINWTSIIFHLLTTVGLFFVGLYLLKVINSDNKKEN